MIVEDTGKPFGEGVSRKSRDGACTGRSIGGEMVDCEAAGGVGPPGEGATKPEVLTKEGKAIVAVKEATLAVGGATEDGVSRLQDDGLHSGGLKKGYGGRCWFNITVRPIDGVGVGSATI